MSDDLTKKGKDAVNVCHDGKGSGAEFAPDEVSAPVQNQRTSTSAETSDIMDRIAIAYLRPRKKYPEAEHTASVALEENDLETLTRVYLNQPTKNGGGTQISASLFENIVKKVKSDPLLTKRIYESIDEIISTFKAGKSEIYDGISIYNAYERLLGLAHETKNAEAVPYLAKYFLYLDSTQVACDLKDDHTYSLAELGECICEIAASNPNDSETSHLYGLVLRKISKLVIHIFVMLEHREECSEDEWWALQSHIEALICYAKLDPDNPSLSEVADTITETVDAQAYVENFKSYYDCSTCKKMTSARREEVEDFILKLCHLVTLTSKELRGQMS